MGRHAQAKRGILSLEYPVEHGQITNWEQMELLWSHAFAEMGVDPRDHPVLLTEAPFNPKANRQRMAEIMFDTFQVPAFYVALQAVLGLYSYGRVTGVVLDCGDGVSHTVPVYDGYSIANAIQKIDLAGRDVTHYMARLLTMNGHHFVSSSDMDIVREIKEQLAYVSLDFNQDMVQAETFGPTERFYTLPDGSKISVGDEQFRCAEALFQPSFLGLESIGVHEALYNSIVKCNIDLRGDLFRNICLSGGTCAMPNFADRIQMEIENLLSDGRAVDVSAPNNIEEVKHCVWSGGSVMASCGGFKQQWLTRQEFHEYGPSAVDRKCF